MILRNGLALSVPVEFVHGFPDGNVTWRLLDATGAELATGAVTPAVGSVSIDIAVPATNNTLDVGDLFAVRDLDWSYNVAGAPFYDTLRYTIEARTPLGASPSGVRTKLGVGKVELPDSEISLMRAYLWFLETATQDNINAATDGGYAEMAMRDAIEARAAFDLLPTMPVRIAKLEDSGTNKFQRQDVDWEAVRAELLSVINDALTIIVPNFDPLINAGGLFITASPSVDPFSG